jgi:DNA-binding transcriptional LysR family regulator
MDHRHLEHFVAIADAGAYSGAAPRSGKAQLTISAAVRRLERELGTPLFERNARQVKLTPAGAVFLPHARDLLIAVEEVRAAVADVTGELAGEVRLGTIGFTLDVDVMRFIAGLQRTHPRLKPRVITRRPPDDLIDDVRHGRIDLAVTVTLSPDAPPPGVEFVVLHREPFVLLVAPDHPLAALDSVPPERLRDQPFVCFPAGHPQRPGMDAVFRQVGIKPDIAFECDAPAHLRLVLDAGVCCLGLASPTAFFEPEIRSVPLACETPIVGTVLALPNALRRSAPARAVANALLSAFGLPASN